jgi:Ser/Thr protein kinase RdoA (MazF antagonist)
VFPPQSVLSHYRPALDGVRWYRASGGFSGAAVWRGEDAPGVPLFALKLWPAGFAAARLHEIHTAMARAAHLPFVPRVLPTTEGLSLVVEAGRAWDVTRWMPGEPRESPSVAEVEAACAAVARLHATWRTSATHEPCPGVLNRLRVLRDWLARPVIRVVPRHVAPDLRSLFQRSVELVASAGPSAIRDLEPWETVRVPVQTCVRDLRGEHVLFRDGEVAGIVDFGAMAPDYPGVDLARLLADFAGANDTQFRAGLNAYRVAGGTLAEPDDFVRLLEQSGVSCSVVGWLVRLSSGSKVEPVAPAIRDRLEQLLGRLERRDPS